MVDPREPDDEPSEEEEDNEPVAIHRRYIPEAIRVLDALSTLEREGTPVASLLDIGAGGAPTALLLMIRRDFDRVWAVSDELPQYCLWWDKDLWLETIGKRTDVAYIEADIFDNASLQKRLGRRRFDVGYLHHTLHHLRSTDCQWEPSNRNDDRHCGNPPTDIPVLCNYEDCDRAVGRFDPVAVFGALFHYCDTVLLSENFYAGADADKETAQGGILNKAERMELLDYLLDKCGQIRFFHPEKKVIQTRKQLNRFFGKLDRAANWMFAVSKPRRRPRSR